MSNLKQVSIRLEPELHQKLINHVKGIKPKTSVNNYLNHLIEREMSLIYEVTNTRKHKYITNDGQVLDDNSG